MSPSSALDTYTKVPAKAGSAANARAAKAVRKTIGMFPPLLAIVAGTMRTRTLVFAASAIVLVAGLSAGLALYATAQDEPEPGADSALLLSPGSSKIYIREIQR